MAVDILQQPGHCPVCDASIGGADGVHWNAASIWCLRCGWAQNWPGRLASVTLG